MSTISESILNSTKKMLGIEPDYDVFDFEIMTIINGVFADLNMLGIGPLLGFAIVDDSTVWTDYLGDNLLLNSVKTYMFLRVKLIFDTPQNSFTIAAMERQIDKAEWQINVYRENAIAEAVVVP